MAANFDLGAYLARVNLDQAEMGASPETLTAVMAAQMRAIAFENVDVVLSKQISMEQVDLMAKLVHSGRGGYCFEQNGLLRLALTALGFEVAPLLCRVRWGKAADDITTFTHMALQVQIPGDARSWLADVGFAGTNSIAPVLLGPEEPPQELPEGFFRTVLMPGGYTELQMQERGGDAAAWRSLYCWRTDEAAPELDLELSNWWSCTKPGARFTSQFFAARTIGPARHHILNDQYVIRADAASAAVSTTIADKAQLCELLRGVFGLALPEDVDGIDRYLPKAGM